MNAIGVFILVVLILVVLCAPRRGAFLGMMAGVLYLTQNQQVVVLGFNLFAMRFLELAGFVRVMARREFSFSRLNKIDRGLLFLYCYYAIVYSFRGSEGMFNAIANATDAFLCYFTFRGLIADLEDFNWFLRSFAVLLAPYTVMVVIETWTGHNLFSFLGAGGFGDWERGERHRAFGTFRNPDLLGTLGVSFLPLYIGLAFEKASRKLGCICIVLCLAIVWASNSGSPIAATAVGLIGWGFWIVRKDMRRIRWALTGLIVLLALVMKAPIWYLPSHISDITGGSGWHRSYLMDVSFQHIGEWWLSGMAVTGTSHWFAYGALVTTSGADITNQFLSFGINAGLGAIALFILLLTRAFSGLGKALATVRSNFPDPTLTETMLWGFGVTLAAHIANWLGITYFDQSYVIWFMQLATISSLSDKYAEPLLIEKTEIDGTIEEADGLESEMQFNKS